MHPFLKNIFLVLTLWAAVFSGKAQQLNFEGSLDTNVMLIGDQINFRLMLQVPEEVPFLWPVFADTLSGKVEIVKQSSVDTTKQGNGLLNIHQDLTITAFDSGYYVIPPIEVLYGDDFRSGVLTEPYLLNVFTVEVDTTQAIMPIKGPMSAPLTFAEIWPWALLGLIVLAISGLAIYLVKKRKKKEPIVRKKRKPKQPAHVIALDELEKLDAEKLWQRDMIKEYHTRLTDTLREYTEERFDILAVEMTTWEIIQSFSGKKIDRRNLEILRETLQLADFVKFAKFKPTPDENTKSMSDAVAFVKQTALLQSDVRTKMPEADKTQITKQVTEV